MSAVRKTRKGLGGLRMSNKVLLGIALTLGIISPVKAQEVPQVSPTQLRFVSLQPPYLHIGYDTNDGKRETVRFIYKIKGVSLNGYFILEKPEIVGIDENGDGDFEHKEFYKLLYLEGINNSPMKLK